MMYIMPTMHDMLPLSVSKVCKKVFYKNMTLYIIRELPSTKYSYIHPSPNHVGIYQKMTTKYITSFIPGIVGKPT